MSDELVDIVDDNNIVVGKAMKSEAHEKGLLHRCVVSEVVDSKGRWLLVKQAADRQDAGQYVSPVGGHVSAGEAEDDALKREAMEELGFDQPFEYKKVGRIIFDRHVIGRHENHLFVLYEIYSDAEPTINHESESFRYFSNDELKQLLQTNPSMFGHAFTFAVKRFYQQLLV